MKIKSIIAALIILTPVGLSLHGKQKAPKTCETHYVPLRREYRKDFTEEYKDFHYRNGRQAFRKTNPRAELCPGKHYTSFGSKPRQSPH